MVAMKSKVWIGQPTRKSCIRICLPFHTFDLRAMDGQLVQTFDILTVTISVYYIYPHYV